MALLYFESELSFSQIGCQLRLLSPVYPRMCGCSEGTVLFARGGSKLGANLRGLNPSATRHFTGNLTYMYFCRGVASNYFQAYGTRTCVVHVVGFLRSQILRPMCVAWTPRPIGEWPLKNRIELKEHMHKEESLSLSLSVEHRTRLKGDERFTFLDTKSVSSCFPCFKKYSHNLLTSIFSLLLFFFFFSYNCLLWLTGLKVPTK